jgi:hypothetical protein
MASRPEAGLILRLMFVARLFAEKMENSPHGGGEETSQSVLKGDTTMTTTSGLCNNLSERSRESRTMEY